MSTKVEVIIKVSSEKGRGWKLVQQSTYSWNRKILPKIVKNSSHWHLGTYVMLTASLQSYDKWAWWSQLDDVSLLLTIKKNTHRTSGNHSEIIINWIKNNISAHYITLYITASIFHSQPKWRIAASLPKKLYYLTDLPFLYMGYIKIFNCRIAPIFDRTNVEQTPVSLDTSPNYLIKTQILKQIFLTCLAQIPYGSLWCVPSWCNTK